MYELVYLFQGCFMTLSVTVISCQEVYDLRKCDKISFISFLININKKKNVINYWLTGRYLE